ncbi:MAG: signal recognition particle subunit [Actinomycetota bacterium]|nr:signal recognition particle subunit [Actinomycetota bacterium]
MFATLSDRLAATFKNLRGKGRLTDADLDATTREIRVALLEADVALPVVKDFIESVRERARGAEVHQALNPAQQIIKIVDEELVEILGGETRRLRFAKNPPTVIMLAGLQGSGKTTLAGKLAHWLRGQQHQPLLVAADLQRPNAVTQLQVVGERAGVPVFAPEPGNVGAAEPTSGRDGERDRKHFGDPVDVARRSIEFAKQKLYDVVIVDTAGRLGIDEELMQQAADIRDAVSPDEVLFVVDAMVGQDAVTTALAFLNGVGFDGVVLTKLDGDARGGAALSVAKVTGRQVMFASNGEKVEDFDAFHPDRMASRILGMGDVLTLIEQAEKAFDKDQAEEMAGKFGRGEDFTFEDFLAQMESVRKMGSMSKLLGMLPGMGAIREQIENIDEREVDRVTAMIKSMTPAERRNHKILNGSRRSRIARGSGTSVSDVNGLVERFTEAQKMMRQMASAGGMPGVPGMPGLPGMGRGKKAKGRTAGPGARKGKGSRSGNPAKRALEQKQWEARQAGRPVPGMPDLPEDFELPEELKGLLPPSGQN